jgi:hypothetical protein
MHGILSQLSLSISYGSYEQSLNWAQVITIAETCACSHHIKRRRSKGDTCAFKKGIFNGNASLTDTSRKYLLTERYLEEWKTTDKLPSRLPVFAYTM